MAITPLQSRIEELLANGSNAVKPQSRIEILLVELLQFIETGMASVFHYRGSVATYADLLLIQNPEVGDVYNVEADSMNYAWDGTAWDTLGAILAIDSTITQNSQNPVTSAAIYSALAGKVDAIVGKGLSTEDYTTAEKEKLSGIASGAEVNVQSDWNQSDNTADDFIKNKPTLGTASASNVASAIGDTSDLPTAAQVNTALAGKQDSLSTAQMNAANSGITSAKVTQYDKDSAAMPEVVNGGAKNKLNFDTCGRSSTYGATYTISGVTYTVNSDGSVSLSGTAGESGSYVMLGVKSTPVNGLSFCDGNHVISGSTAKVNVRARANSTNDYLVSDPGTGAVLVSTTYSSIIYISLRVEEGVDVTGEVVRPMICTKAAWDVSHAYVPYCPSMAEMADDISDLENGGVVSRVYGVVNATKIQTNDDLNNYSIPGIYCCENSTIAQTLSNCPATQGFKLEIRYTMATGRLNQLIYENLTTGAMYFRTYTANGWGAWNHIETTDGVFGRGTLIASGADLDDLKSIGMYYSNDKTRSQSLTNSPFTTTGFTLEVKKSYQSQGNTDGINQIAYSFANDAFTVKARIYRYSGSPATWSWTDWQTLSFVTT